MNYMKHRSIINIVVLFLLFQPYRLIAQVSFPSFISDNMVLQRQSDVAIWGKSAPLSSINVTCSWDNAKYQTIANDDGKWMLKIKTPNAGGPYSIQVNDKQIKNILIGEVWVCSGQSNMTMPLAQAAKPEDGSAVVNNPQIRLFNVARQLGDVPQEDCSGSWKECTPESAKSFSAVAYYFGKKLYDELHVPVGLIHSSWGGSTAQAWVKEELLKQDTAYNGYYLIEKQKERRAKPGDVFATQHSPAKLYNAMIHPLMPYGIKGVIWYQGESNQDYYPGDPDRYSKLFPLLVNSWRDEWKQGDFPFYYVQIAPFPRNFSNVGALLRDVQRKSLSIKNTGMAVTLDIGDTTNIHPKNKFDVGNRLALWALAKDYGKSDLVYSGPLYKNLSIKRNKAIISFTNTGSGLMAKENRLVNFEIAGADRLFYKATAKIQGKSVVVFSENVKKPVAVRYAFTNTSIASLFNEEGLPASSFRTDNWPVNTKQILK